MVVNESLIYTLPQETVSKISSFIYLLQALGFIVVIYLVISIINLFQNRRKNRELMEINKSLSQIKSLLNKKRN